jgi:uncharacterized membrane protein
MTTKLWAVALVLLGSVIGAFGSLYFKMGSDMVSRNIRELRRNYKLFYGFIFYGVSSILYMIGLRGGELSILYPLCSTGYIWIAILSVKFLGEKMNRWKWAGLFVIIVGIGVIGISNG